MKGRQVILGHIKGREIAALTIDGVLSDLLIEPIDEIGFAPETVLRAKVDRPMKGQGGAIVQLPSGTGFFRNAKGLVQGQSILVQVSGHAEPGKAVPVTNRLIFKGRTVIVTPGAAGTNISRRIKDEEMRIRMRACVETEVATASGFGVIVRSEAPQADDDEIAVEVDALTQTASQVLQDTEGAPEVLLAAPTVHEIAWREWSLTPGTTVETDKTALEHTGILDAIDALMTPYVPLPIGSYFVEPTRALVAVDVNTGGDTSQGAGLKANIACARDLPRQLRLRGLGGQITIDFAPTAKRDRKQLEQVLTKAFRADSVETTLVGWTPLGHFELTRKRERIPLSEVLK